MRRRRRLLIASQPFEAGVPRHIVDLLHGLRPDEWTIDVACPRGSLLWLRLGGDPGISLHGIGGKRRPALSDVRSLARLLPLVAEADVVHGHSSKAGFLVRVAALLRRRVDRCVFTPHGWSFWTTRGIVARAYVLLERIAARWCRVILVGSEAEREAGLRNRIGKPQQYRVVPNGVDLASFAAEAAPVPGRVIFLGRLSRQKRPDLAIRAFRLVRERYPRAELHLAGDGPQRRELERLTAHLGLVEAVRFLGNRDDVPDLLRAAACVVLASDWEGCPLSVIEAMAAGAPVVATRVGGVGELVEHGRTGLLVEPRDERALADALAALLDDPIAAAKLGERGREAARARLSRERMAAEILRIYDELAPQPYPG